MIQTLIPFFFNFSYFSFSSPLVLLNEDYSIDIQIPDSWKFDAFFTNIGKGKGKIKSIRICQKQCNVYKQFCNKPDYFRKYLHLEQNEFHDILEDLQQYSSQLQDSPDYDYNV